MVCAIAPGNAEISAKLPGSNAVGKAYVTVNTEQITELIADPVRLEVGDAVRLPILGRTAAGVHELFPQADLKLSAGGRNPAAIGLPGGDWIKGVTTGEATVEMTWRNDLKEQVAVTVVDDPWGNLQIKPSRATINKGQALKYEVTATRGGLRRVIGPEQGLQLVLGDVGVAQVLDDLSVGGKQEGRTTVVAKYASLGAEAALDVTAGNGVATGVAGEGGVIVQPAGVTIAAGGAYAFQGGAANANTQSAGSLTGVDPKAAHLVVAPAPLLLWTGEDINLGSVKLDPGGGQPPIPVDFQVTAPDGQTVLKLDYGNKIIGLAKGVTQATVTATDTRMQSLSANVPAQVDNPDPLRCDPAEMTLQVGEATPPITVSGKGADGIPYQAPVNLETQDDKVVADAPNAPGRFVAKAPGRTLLKACYRGADVFATVTVPGKRFLQVKATPNLGSSQFDVTIEVLASAAEGPLAYRVSWETETTPDTWTPNEPQGDSRRVVLHTTKVSYGQPGTLYHLGIDARDAAGKLVQQYSMTLRVAAPPPPGEKK
jgi:hypothetical protein